MTSKLALLFGSLVPSVFALSIPSRAASQFTTPSRVEVRPSSSLLSDWQQDGEPAQWAEGYPKVWGSEKVKYTQVKPHSRTLFGPGVVTPDDRFLVQMNDTNVQVIYLESNITVIDFLQTSDAARVTTSSKGGYDLLISDWKVSANKSYVNENYQYHLDSKGIPTGAPIKRAGGISSFDPDAIVFSQTDPYIYDLDDPKYKVVLSGHTDSVMSGAFSPNGKYVATAAWDGKGKLWHANNGSFIADFENTKAQNWVTRFSPNSKYLAIAAGPKYAKIHRLSDLTAPPVVIDGFTDWVRTLEWSPDGEYVAAGSWGQVQVYSLNENKIVQKWQLADASRWEVDDVTWFEGGQRLAYRVQGALELYDFETNLKYQWGPGPSDSFLNGFNIGGTFQLEREGWIGGFDWDHSVRFWEYPEVERRG
ncbi:WD40 repeat-like protein [Lophiostoma macrostomum CBS 122681]|uniref:WD40 repeat-like protein n=1 Tax=Lophiostoma macrostomum CBS 122681 TaxID=1314788 RepID=A0A6A6TEW3_9PLEO|nr:WD40 repeat-like protein [Lophiostoma macrostomum CBS 122681]